MSKFVQQMLVRETFRDWFAKSAVMRLFDAFLTTWLGETDNSRVHSVSQINIPAEERERRS